MKALFLSLTLALLTALPASAQDGVFKSYDEMRDRLDSLFMSRQIKQVLLDFGGADEMTIQQLDSLETQVRQIYAVDFEEKDIVRRADLENGFHQEMIAYWTGVDYIYVYIFGHEKDDAYVSINMRFNSDYSKLNALF